MTASVRLLVLGRHPWRQQRRKRHHIAGARRHQHAASRRGIAELRLLTAGPGRLAQALGITREHDGLPLDRPPFELSAGEHVEVETGPRIGITKAADRPWRYGEAGSRFLSRPLKRGRRA